MAGSWTFPIPNGRPQGTNHYGTGEYPTPSVRDENILGTVFIKGAKNVRKSTSFAEKVNEE